MSVYLFGQGANFALLVFGLTALVVVGVSLLLYRIVGAAKSADQQHMSPRAEGCQMLRGSPGLPGRRISG